MSVLSVRHVGISPTGVWKKILTCPDLTATALLVEIRAVYSEIHGAYEWPRVWRQLKERWLGKTGQGDKWRFWSSLA